MPSRSKHDPKRTCVACHSVQSKRDLVRIVIDRDGQLSIDETGKAPGRGAYLCGKAACFHSAAESSALNRALKTELTDSDRALLRQHGDSLMK